MSTGRWALAVARAWAPGDPGAGLSEGTWMPTRGETAFCGAGHKKRLSPRLLRTLSSEHRWGAGGGGASLAL